MKRICFRLVATSIIVAGIILTSCDSESGKIDNEELTDNVELKAEEFDEGMLAELLTFKDYDFLASSKINIVIVRFTIRNGRTGCISGWGICDVTWFPVIQDFIDWLGDFFTRNDTSLYVPVLHDSRTNELYMEILLDAPVPRGISMANHPLTVDEDVLVTKFTSNSIASGINSMTNKNLILKNGKYVFDECMGEYGGFRINLFLD